MPHVTMPAALAEHTKSTWIALYSTSRIQFFTNTNRQFHIFRQFIFQFQSRKCVPAEIHKKRLPLGLEGLLCCRMHDLFRT